MLIIEVAHRESQFDFICRDWDIGYWDWDIAGTGILVTGTGILVTGTGILVTSCYWPSQIWMNFSCLRVLSFRFCVPFPQTADMLNSIVHRISGFDCVL